MTFVSTPHPWANGRLEAYSVVVDDGLRVRMQMIEAGDSHDTWFVTLNESRLAEVIGKQQARRTVRMVLEGIASALIAAHCIQLGSTPRKAVNG